MARAERKSLLLGTALASTLLIGSVLAPSPAHALTNCLTGNPPPGPITVSVADSIICINTDDRFDSTVIDLFTSGANHYINLVNSGNLSATSASNALGINTFTNGGSSPINIDNSGDIDVVAGSDAFGINAFTNNGFGPISIVNSGDMTLTGDDVFAISAFTNNGHGPISVVNSGLFRATASSDIFGISTFTNNGFGPTNIVNSGSMEFTAREDIFGISTFTNNGNGPTSIVNNGNMAFTAGEDAFGIDAFTNNGNGPISIENSGDFTLDAGINANGISAFGNGDNSPIDIENRGDVEIKAQRDALGIGATTDGVGSHLALDNVGEIRVTAFRDAFGFFARTFGAESPIDISNSGPLTITAGEDAFGISATTNGGGSPINVVNSGDVSGYGGQYLGGQYLIDIRVSTDGNDSPISIVNRGDLTAQANERAFGVFASTSRAGSPISIVNSGDIRVTGNPNIAVGISAQTFGPDSPIVINNLGSVFGRTVGIVTFSYEPLNTIVFYNSGDITAGSYLAIDSKGASTSIFNKGKITGFVDLTANDDTFINQKGGVWVTKLTSYFGEGSDIVQNLAGGTIKAATDPSVKEFSAIAGLERFENKGLITLQDDAAGDVFEIRNEAIFHLTPKAYNAVYADVFSGIPIIEFKGSDKSTLAVDAFLGAPGKSESDIFIIDGNVSGKTKVDVNNTNAGPGVFNKEGIPVVFVGGPNVQGNEFFLPNPIDTGFFDYDLFFRPTGSGVFELRSFLGQGAFVLPQLITAAQDQWHSGSSTWFDRTADLRVLLNGGAAPAENPDAKYAEGTPAP